MTEEYARCQAVEREVPKALRAHMEWAATQATQGRGETAEIIAAECDSIKALLLAKNKAYGNSALDPLRIFSKSNTVEQLNVRIDDKLSRLVRGDAAGEDAELDLIGYLILKRIAKTWKGGAK